MMRRDSAVMTDQAKESYGFRSVSSGMKGNFLLNECSKMPRRASAFGAAMFFFASFFCMSKRKKIKEIQDKRKEELHKQKKEEKKEFSEGVPEGGLWTFGQDKRK